MTRKEIREKQKYLRQQNSRYSKEFVEISDNDFPCELRNLVKALRNNSFLVQIYKDNDSIRLSICRTEIDNQGKWIANITWEDLQEIKKQMGYGDRTAVEIYPKEKDIVNVANMRHLWIVDNLDIGWKKR